MLNHIDLMGRLTRDPELRRTPSGVAVANFAIAVDRDYSSDGEKQTDFIEIVAWRNTAEFATKYFAKGKMAVISGRLQMRQYTARDGSNRTAAEVIADSIYFGDSKKNSADNAETQFNIKPAMAEFEDFENDSDLPF